MSTTRQDTDGTPYFAYYDQASQFGFVWDGKAPVIEVSHGGMGEQVVDEIKVAGRVGINSATILRWMDWFQLVCINYVRIRNGGSDE